MPASEAPWAYTLVPIHQILAGATVLTLPMTIVDVDVAVDALPAREAITVIAANQVFARKSIKARLPFTLIGVQLASSPHPLLWADALKAVHLIHTGAACCTWIRGTLINVKGTGGSTPA